jgi:hypothetical protein
MICKFFIKDSSLKKYKRKKTEKTEKLGLKYDPIE